MTKKEFISLVETITEASPGTLSGDDKILALDGWDSLAVVSFIAKIDEACGITLSPKGIVSAKNLNDLMALLGDKITA